MKKILPLLFCFLVSTFFVAAQTPCSITFFFNGVIVCDDNGTPNDPSDDTFTTQVRVIGSGFGSNGWVGSDPLSSTGPYDQFVTIGPYLIADGPFNFSVQDVDDPSCETVQVQISPPAPCSTPVCDLDVIGGAVICNDGGTPGDLSDDTFFQNIVVSNGGNSGNWVSTSPDNDSGIFGISQTVGPFPSNSGQDLTFTITDANNPNCSTTYTIENPCASQASCNITDPGIGSITCNDFNSPTSPGDDYAVVELNPTGTGLNGTYIVTSPFVSASPGFGTYGTPSVQNLFGAAQAGADITLTLTDSNDPNCSITFTIPNPAPCPTVPDCDLTNPGLGFTTCNDNGTPTDPSDDFYTFPLNPVGSGLGSGYTVSVSGGTVSPPGGNYGSETIFTLTGIGPPAGISVIVTDNDDPNCFTNTIINLPPPCSTAPPCDINYAQIGNVTCSDNGTPNDPNDDTFTFILQVVGDGTSPNGWTANDPLGTTGDYNVVTTMGPYPISGGGFPVVVTDNDDPSCTTISVTIVPPAPCSTPPPCNLTGALINTLINCDDQGTSNPDDDVFIIELQPEGTNLSGTYNLVSSVGSITPAGPQPYGIFTTFELSISSTNGQLTTLTIVDTNDPSCTAEVISIFPSSCSTLPCNIEATLISTSCFDNNTPSDPSDDLFQGTILIENPGNNGGWLATYPNGGQPVGNYGDAPGFGFAFINNGPFTVTFTDQLDPNCTVSVVVDPPPTCSSQPPCDIEVTLTSAPTCSDNGTPNDPSDDTFSFNGTISGTGIGSSWTANDINNTSGNYNISTLFGPYPISGGPIDITITDGDDPACTNTFSVDAPPTCSDPCNLNSANLSNTTCNDSGTPSDPSDDIIQFTLNPSGQNTGGSYSVTASSGTVTPNTAAYGSAATFLTSPGTAGSGPITLTITDSDDPSCSIVVTLPDPGTCSNTTCAFTDPGVISVTCDDAGTPGNPGDDFVLLELFPIGVALSPIGYNLSSPDVTVTPGFGNLGVITAFQLLGAANAGPTITLILSDIDHPDCFLAFTIDNPAPCSVEPCNLNTPTVITPICDNGVIDFELLVNGTGTGTNYQVNAPGGVLTAGTNGNYGQVSPFSFLPNNLSQNNFTLTITDSNDPTCSQTVSLDNPCDACLITSAAVSNVQCADNGTPGDPTDDLITFSILADGVSTAGSYTISAPGQAVQPSTGTFGSLGSFSLLPGSAGSGPVTLTLTDASDSNCTTTVQLSDPGTCSDACAINAFVTQTTCIPTGVPEDDFFQATIQVINPVGAAGWTAQTPLGPVTGSYNQDVDLGPFLISQGSFSLTITDQLNPGCSTTLLVVPPGPCSVVCEADTTIFDLQSCNPLDTGTVIQNLTGQEGCDSIVITATSLLPSDSIFLVESSCNPADTGIATQVLINQFGCDSVVVTNTVLVDSDTTLIDLQSCNPLDTGTVVQNLTGQTGCDSIIITATTLLPSDSIFLVESSCNPADTGIATQVLINQFGCDSVVVTNTVLVDSDTTLIDLQSCNPLDTGTVVQNLTGQTGCDSIIITATTLLPSDSIFLVESSCNPADTGIATQVLINQFGCDSVVVTNTVLVDSDTTLIDLQSCNPLDTGTVVQNLTGQTGCDSIVITTTSLLPSDTTVIFSESCNPIDTGTVENLLQNQSGCDSLVITTTTLLPSDTTLLFSESCNPADTGTVAQILANQFGCDSTVITTTTLLPSDTTLLFSESCNTADTGTVAQIMANQFGCDSTVITTTTLLPSDTTLLFTESCNPADTGTVAQIMANQFGCDSTVITTTTLLPSDTTLLFSESCNPADTGTVAQIMANQFGCDSTVITTTTLLPSDTTLLFTESCNPADTGTVAQIMTNQFGCDSTVITTTTLLPSDTTLLFTESCNPADTGTVAQIMANQFGCDSTVITTTTLLPRNTTVFFSQSCNPADTGTVTQILTNQFGCDSIVTTQVLLFSDPDYQLVTDTLCAGESVVINGTVYDQDRPVGQEVVQSIADGCDSVIIDIALLFAEPEAEITTTNPACEGLTGLIEIGPPQNGFAPYTINAAGQILEVVSAIPVTIDVLAGDYTVELTDALGCTVSQAVSIAEGISPELSIDGPLILDEGDTITLRPLINFEPETIDWRPAGQLSCSNCLNPVLEASESTTLLLTASLGGSCSVSANVQIIVERMIDIYAPNVFSPNGDGRNDRFTLFSAPGQIDRIERMEIYDRWGNQVFTQTEFPANNVAVGWDGTFRGEPMGPGVFTYYAQVRLQTGRIILQKGDITLIR
jgi:gliding motility-associated-like protein